MAVALKAYEWRNEFEGTMRMVYATNANEARMWISGEENIRYIDVKVHRLPWADQYGEEDNIPPKVCLENGWPVQCVKCGIWMYGVDEAHQVKEGFCCEDCYGEV